MRLYIFLLGLFLIALSCSEEESEILEIEEIEIVRMEIDFSLSSGGNNIARYIYDRSTISGVVRNDLQASSIPSGSNLDATVKLYEQDGNELKEITSEISRYAVDYQIFIEPIDVDVIYKYDDMDRDENPLGLTWTVSTAFAETGSVNIKLIKGHDKNDPSIQLGLSANAVGDVLIDIELPIRVGL